jgi:hypothetical protein
MKIGDKVKIINSISMEHGNYIENGMHGIIENIDLSAGTWKHGIRLNNGEYVACRESEFELVEEEKSMFKVGDKVKFIGDDNGTLIKRNKIYTIKKINESFGNKYISVKEIESPHSYSIEKFELVQDFTLSDIKERWLVVFANGKEAYLDKDNYFRIIEKGKTTGEYIHIRNFTNDLKTILIGNYSIVKILKPRYEEVWNRPAKKKIKEVTMKEVNEKFGEEVLIKEDK